MAAARTKITREPPVRGGPIRQPARGIPVASSAPSVEPSATTGVVEMGFRTAEMMVKAADEAVKGVVERSVDTAYMVIDEYMERGRVAARLQTQESDGRNGMSTDPPYTTPFGATSDLMAPWAQMMRMWADGLSALVPGGPGAVNAWMNAFVPGSAVWAGAGMNANAKVEVHVSSKPVTAVTVDLHPGADALVLTAEPVEPAGDGAAMPAVMVVLESSPGLVRVKVRVPDDQLAGSQSFMVRDAYRQQRGTVRVDVLPES
jgi:hypothetical protein